MLDLTSAFGAEFDCKPPQADADAIAAIAKLAIMDLLIFPRILRLFRPAGRIPPILAWTMNASMIVDGPRDRNTQNYVFCVFLAAFGILCLQS